MGGPLTSAELLQFYAPPAVAMAALTFVVLAALGALRLSGIVRRQYSLRYFKLMQRDDGMRPPAHAEAASRNFINLFELPVLLYALVPLLVLSGERNQFALACMWMFVAFRALHSLIHVTINALALRFGAYLLSSVALLLAWASFAASLLG